MSSYAALHELGERSRAAERRRGPDPYPPPSGPAPSLAELKRQRDQIIAVAARHGALSVRVFGSVARSQQQPDSDLDLLVELDGRRRLLEQAALRRELEQLLGCPVHLLTSSALQSAQEHTRERIKAEALAL